MMLGGMCDPQPPLNNDCEPVQCPDGQHIVCVDKCVRYVDIGERCSTTDPCANNGTCVPGATCVGTPDPPPGEGRCKRMGGELLAVCKNPDYHMVGPSDECASGLYCRSSTCGLLYNMCARPVQIGGYCDNQVLEAGGPPCHVCGPGMVCTGPEGQGMCTRQCEADAGCPCEFVCQQGMCRKCRSLGEPCDVNRVCCDGTMCGGQGLCCMPRDKSGCETNADCCGSDRCVAGTSVACKSTGKPCGSDNECCAGQCMEGLCTPACPSGNCELEGLQGPCRWGKWECRPGKEPKCVQAVFAEAEVCDSKDNDCNGKLDDIAEQACENGQVMGVSCQPGFRVPGKMKCVGGQAKCVARACDTSNPNDTDCYCTQCGAAAGGSGKPCGQCAATPCLPGVTMCTPSAACVSSDTIPQQYECNVDTQCALLPPACWTPADVRLPPNHCYGVEK